METPVSGKKFGFLLLLSIRLTKTGEQRESLGIQKNVNFSRTSLPPGGTVGMGKLTNNGRREDFLKNSCRRESSRIKGASHLCVCVCACVAVFYIYISLRGTSLKMVPAYFK